MQRWRLVSCLLIGPGMPASASSRLRHARCCPPCCRTWYRQRIGPFAALERPRRFPPPPRVQGRLQRRGSTGASCWAIGLECRLACSKGSPEDAVTILEWVTPRLPAKGVDVTTLADLALVRATALRMLERYKEALPYASQAAAYYEQHGPIQALEARLEMTFSLDGLGRREEAVAVAARSAAELDTHRYQLGNSSSRLIFARANEKARTGTRTDACKRTPACCGTCGTCPRPRSADNAGGRSSRACRA